MNSLGIALQGIGFATLLVAVQGFAEVNVTYTPGRSGEGPIRYQMPPIPMVDNSRLREDDSLLLLLL